MLEVGTIIDGNTFKKMIAVSGWTLVKYLESKDFSQPQKAHHNYHYKFGLNQIPEDEINLNPKKECSAGGLYFTYVESYKWLNEYWFSVTVPDDAKVLLESNGKFKTDKLILLIEIQPTEAICIAAVQYSSHAFTSVKKQTDAICLAAVRYDGMSLFHVKNQTEAICVAAVRRNVWALCYVKNLTKKIRDTAIQQDPRLASIILERIETERKDMMRSEAFFKSIMFYFLAFFKSIMFYFLAFLRK